MAGRWLKNPLAQKRWRRFRGRKRAIWSLWCVSLMFGISLVSELICNDRPLLMRFNTRWYVPVFRYYPASTFTGGDEATRTDYRALRNSPAFRSTPGNWILFAPIPFSPYESIDPASLQSEATVKISLTPVPRVGNVNVDSAMLITGGQASGFFFGTNDAAVVGIALDSQWTIPPELRAAIARRLRNQSAPPVTLPLTSADSPPRSTTASLTAYTPRPSPPSSVRITFRDPEQGGAVESLSFKDKRRLPSRPYPAVWAAMTDAARDQVCALASQALHAFVPPTTLDVGARAYRMEASKQDVTWPHAPTPGHWMGIDSSGRDVLARILYGFRISMSFALLLVLTTMAVGILIGAVQGYFGGRTDILAQRLIEIWSALPFLYVMILLGSVYGPSFPLLLVCYGIFNWIGISYYIRAEFLRLRRQPYVEAARCLGVPAWRIMRQHILPNAITPVITFFPFSLVGAIAALYGLDYLGFGLPPPTPSWGELLQQAQQYRWAWWLIFYPAAAIFIVMLLCVFVGEGIRDAFDPKPISRME